jgi:hypothetical protein
MRVLVDLPGVAPIEQRLVAHCAVCESAREGVTTEPFDGQFGNAVFAQPDLLEDRVVEEAVVPCVYHLLV